MKKNEVLDFLANEMNGVTIVTNTNTTLIWDYKESRTLEIYDAKSGNRIGKSQCCNYKGLVKKGILDENDWLVKTTINLLEK